MGDNKLKKEINLEKEKKKVLLMHISFPIAIILIVILFIFIAIVFFNFNKTFKIKKYINSNKEELQKIIDKEIDLSDLKDQSLIKSVKSSCNEISCYTRFDTDEYGFGSNSCYTGFYYTEKDLMHKYEYDDRIIEGDNLKSYKVKEETGDNTLYLTYITNHWYYFESCY